MYSIHMQTDILDKPKRQIKAIVHWNYSYNFINIIRTQCLSILWNYWSAIANEVAKEAVEINHTHSARPPAPPPANRTHSARLPSPPTANHTHSARPPPPSPAYPTRQSKLGHISPANAILWIIDFWFASCRGWGAFYQNHYPCND